MDVGPSLARDAARLAALKEREAVLGVGDDVFALSLDEDASVLILADYQWTTLVPVLKQVV